MKTEFYFFAHAILTQKIQIAYIATDMGAWSAVTTTGTRRYPNAILVNIIGGAALATLFVVFYALDVSAGREATQQREEDISMEHTHGGEEE